MTPTEFKKKIAETIEEHEHDNETAHVAMDHLLADTLTSLGYGEGIALFSSYPKWYS